MNHPPRPPSQARPRPLDSRLERESASGARSARGDEPEEGTYFLGRYRVIDEIGRGGMASVHLARVDGPGGFHKWVAIKRIHPHLVENDQLVDMFLDEARMAAGISHPNVAQVFDIGKDRSTYWIAMEYLHGEPVRELTRVSEELGRPVTSPAIAARIIADAAEGLHAAHELCGKNGELLGLVHRDVTPHNLFVTYDGYTKVVDFGIAKAQGRLASTHAGELKGKMAYMAPEQLRGQELDRRTDVFALGIVLWELTTNQRLFRRDSDLDTLERVQACVIPRPTEIVPGYPRLLEEIVLTALARDKAARYQTARAFSRALQTFLRHDAFVGFEEVGELMKATFVDRLRRRNDHLAWAGEVTGTLAPDVRPMAPSASDEISTLDSEPDSQRPHQGAGAPSGGVRSVAAQAEKFGMMEDDDEAATLVARDASSYLASYGIGPAAQSPAAIRGPSAAIAPASPARPLPAAGRPPMASDATQLLAPERQAGGGTDPPPGLGGQTISLPAAPRMPAAFGPYGTRPLAAVDSVAPQSSGVAATQAMSTQDDPELVATGVLPRMFASDPTTEANQPLPPRRPAFPGPQSDPTPEASVPASAVGFRPPQNADHSIVALNPYTQKHGLEPSLPDAHAAPAFSPLETQLSERTRARNARLRWIVALLAAACALALTFLLVTVLRGR